MAEVQGEIVVVTEGIESEEKVDNTAEAKVEDKADDNTAEEAEDDNKDDMMSCNDKDDEGKSYTLIFRYRTKRVRLTFYKPPPTLNENHSQWEQIVVATNESLDTAFGIKISPWIIGITQFLHGPLTPLNVVIKSPKRYSQCYLDVIIADDSPLLADLQIPRRQDIFGPVRNKSQLVKMKKILEKLNLENYFDMFVKQEIDYESFLLLEEGDLKEMDIPIGPRKKIAREIQTIRNDRDPEEEQYYQWIDTFSQLSVARNPPFTVQPFPLTRLYDLEHRDNFATFLSLNLRYYGWAFLKLPDDMLAELNIYKQTFAEFFALSQEEKEKSCTGKGIYGGYYDETDREMFHVAPIMLDQNPPWRTPTFQEHAIGLFRFLEKIGKLCLSALAKSLGINPALFLDVCEEQFGPRKLGSSTRVCKYKKQAENTGIICMEHTDTTILSVAPVSSVPELQFYDRGNAKWVYAEGEVDDTHIIVFVGRILSRMTAGYYQPAFHRVFRRYGEERMSMPFFLRPKAEATMDCVKVIESSNLTDFTVPANSNPETVGEWMSSKSEVLVKTVGRV